MLWCFLKIGKIFCAVSKREVKSHSLSTAISCSKRDTKFKMIKWLNVYTSDVLVYSSLNVVKSFFSDFMFSSTFLYFGLLDIVSLLHSDSVKRYKFW